MKTKINNKIKKENKKLHCGFTLCIHNDACCLVPASNKNTYCKIATNKEDVGLDIDESFSEDNNSRYKGCNKFILNEKKITKCVKCQIEEYGEISLPLLDIDLSYDALKKNMEEKIKDSDEDDFFDDDYDE